MERNQSSENYDQELKALTTLGLNYLPYIGRLIPAGSRLMILGESCYAWTAKATGKTTLEDITADQYHIRKNVCDHMTQKRGFFNNIVKAVTGYEKMTQEQCIRFWGLSIFHNLVTVPMHTKKHRPSEIDYKTGWNVFWELQKVLRPSVCIMLGTENAKIDTFISVLRTKMQFIDYKKELNLHCVKIGRYYAKTLDVPMSGDIVKFIFIKHPSAFFSWGKWHNFLKSQQPEIIDYYQNEVIRKND